MHENYGDLDYDDLEAAEKAFCVFAKRTEDYVCIAEAAGAPHTDAQTTNKVFSTLLNVFHDGVREWLIPRK